MGYNTLFTIFSFVLFGALMLSDNGMIARNSELVLENQYSLAAFAFAQSVIDEATTKAFDEQTVGGIRVPDSSSFSGTPGPETGEAPPACDNPSGPGYWSASHFDDIDDYQGYRRAAPDEPRLQGDTLDVRVAYVDVASPEIPAGVRTYCKRMLVTVHGPYLGRAYQVAHVFSY